MVLDIAPLTGAQ